MIFCFGDFSLDCQRRELREKGVLRIVEPQVFDLLQHLVRNRHRVVDRDELFNTIWKGRAVSDASLSTRINAARSAIGDNGTDQHSIRTLRTKGFRFVGPVTESAPAAATLSHSTANEHRNLDGQPVLAVLPFANLTGDSRRHALAQGLTEALIFDLRKSGWLSVISRSARFGNAESPPSVRNTAAALNARYVLQGAIQEMQDRIRFSARLIDALTGRKVWTERFEQDAKNAFAAFDHFVEKVAGQVELQIYLIEELRAQHPSLETLSIWQVVVRALELMSRRDRNGLIEAQQLLQWAASRAPDASRVFSLLSIATTLFVHMGWANRQDAVPRALEAAQRAISLNPDDAWAHAALGYATIWQRPEESILPLNRALRLNPDFAVAHYFLTLGATFAGYHADFEKHASAAQRLAPRDLLARGYAGAHNNVRATAAFAAERYREGIEYARAAVIELPSSPTAHRALLINLAGSGDLKECRQTLRALQALAPAMSRQWLKLNAVWSDQPTMNRYIDAFKTAGLR